MPSSTSSNINGHLPNSANGPLPDGTLTSSPSSSQKQQNQHHQTTRHSSNTSPLSIALPVSIRSNGSSNGSHGYSQTNGHPPLSMSHPPPSSSSTLQYMTSNGPHSSIYNSQGWQTHSTSDEHTVRTNTISYAQQHYHSYQQHQHHQLQLQQHQQQLQQQHQQQQQLHSSSTPSTYIDTTLRRRRLSSSASSKHARASEGSRPSSANKTSNITPHHTRRFTTLISDQEPDTTYLWGYLLFFATMLGFTISMYALVASNYMPMTGNKVSVPPNHCCTRWCVPNSNSSASPLSSSSNPLCVALAMMPNKRARRTERLLFFLVLTIDTGLDQARQPLLHVGPCHDSSNGPGGWFQLAWHEAVPTQLEMLLLFLLLPLHSLYLFCSFALYTSLQYHQNKSIFT